MLAPMSDTLVVNEIYLSLQGESTFAGLPCIFIRLTACDLRCSYCDTAYAFTAGTRRSLAEIRREVRRLARPFAPPAARRALRARRPAAAERLPLVELTGGEPLLQKNSLPLLRALCDDHFTVLLETNGARDISPVDPRVRRIVDLKCPSSGEAAHNRWENLACLRPTDQLKFVIASRQDYQWAKACIARRQLAARCPLLFSWAQPLAPAQRHPALKPVPPGHTPLSRRELAEAIIADALPVRFQIQLHKVIWAPAARGV